MKPETNVFDWIRQHEEEIITAHNRGDKRATDIIQFTHMYQSCPEAGALGMLKAAVEAFKEAKKEAGE